MKKWIAILLCVCALSGTAFASDDVPDFLAEYEALYGKVPVAAEFLSDEEYQAAYDVWLAGLENYVFRRTAEYEQQRAVEEEAARIAAEKEAAEKAAEEQAPVTPPETVESAGSSYETDTSVPVSSGPVSKYPDRVRVDSAGNIWSLDGELLSPGTTPAYAPDSVPDEEGTLLPDELVDSDNLSPVADADPSAVISDSDNSEGSPVWYIDDLRPTDIPSEVLTGLKSMITSIFGEYTPVTTTSVISETVGDETHQYLVETVAPGAAGVDYEWVAGVLLFAIMLYCLMKLLGGVLK